MAAAGDGRFRLLQMWPFGNTQRQEFQVCLPEVLRVEVAQYSPTLIDLICSSLREKATWKCTTFH